MTVEGFDLTIQELRAMEPFQIFTIVLKNGDYLEIDFPGALHFSHGVAIFHGPSGAKKVFDADSVLQIIPSPAEDAAK